MSADIRSLRLKLHNDRRPITPVRDWRMWLLAIPSILSSVGFCCFAILALAFTEIRGLPWWVRTGLIIVGGIAVAVGGEVGTPAVVLEVFRKICGGWYPEQSGIRRGIMIATDISSTIISLFATLAQFLVAFAALLVVAAQTTQWVTSINAVWAPYTEIWGPIAIGLLAALDAYGGFSELGMYLGDHDQRMTRWVNELERLEVEMNHSRPTALDDLVAKSRDAPWDLEDDPSTIERYKRIFDSSGRPVDVVLDTDRYQFGVDKGSKGGDESAVTIKLPDGTVEVITGDDARALINKLEAQRFWGGNKELFPYLQRPDSVLHPAVSKAVEDTNADC